MFFVNKQEPVRVVEGFDSLCERDVMFPKIVGVFARIPLKFHSFRIPYLYVYYHTANARSTPAAFAMPVGRRQRDLAKKVPASEARPLPERAVPLSASGQLDARPSLISSILSA